MEQATDELTNRQAGILRFESQWFKFAGAKEARIRELWDCSPTAYYAELNTVLAMPAAAREFPMVVARLKRLRDRRRAARTG